MVAKKQKIASTSTTLPYCRGERGYFERGLFGTVEIWMCFSIQFKFFLHNVDNHEIYVFKKWFGKKYMNYFRSKLHRPMICIRKLRIRPIELQQLIRLQKFQNYYVYIFLFNFRRVFLFLQVFLRLYKRHFFNANQISLNLLVK